MTQEALKLALEALEANHFLIHGSETKGGLAFCMDGYYSGCFDIDSNDKQTNKAITAIKEALAQPEHEPVAYIHRNEYNEYRLEPHDSFDIKSIPFNVDVPLFKAPQRTWVGLMRGVRVDGDTVVITVKGGNDAARKLCGELLKEKNT